MIPSTDAFRADAKKLMQRIKDEGENFEPMIEIIIAQELLNQFVAGGNTALTHTKQRLELVQAKSVTEA